MVERSPEEAGVSGSSPFVPTNFWMLGVNW